MSTRARATSLSAVRHGGLRLPARTRIARLLQAAGARGVLPTVHTDGLWYLDRSFTRPWKYPEDLERQVEGALDPSGFPVPVQYGPDLIVNGTFDSGPQSWSSFSASLSAVGGELQVLGAAAGARGEQGVPTVVGRRYRALAQLRVGTAASAVFTAREGSGAFSILNENSTTSTTPRWLALEFRASTTITIIQVRGPVSGQTVFADNVTVQEVIEDWSWLGAERVTNGTFDTSTSGWSEGAATLTSVGGALRVTQATAIFGFGGQLITGLTANRSYRIEFDVRALDPALPARLYFRPNGYNDTTNELVTVAVTSTAWVRQSYVYTSPGTQLFLRATANSNTVTGSVEFDNITVREIPGHPLIAPSAGAGMTPTARVNQLQRTEWLGAVAGTPGSAPTGWAFGFSTGSLSIPQAGQLEFSVSATRHHVTQSVAVVANTQYRARVKVVANSGLNASSILVWNHTSLAGASIQYQINDQNVSTVAVPQAGDELACILTVGSTGGTLVPRFGAGCSANDTGTVRLSDPDIRPAIYTGPAYPEYQRVNDGTPGVFDYDWQGFPVRLEAQANGRGLRSAGTVNFTNTDALHWGLVAVKTSDAAATEVLMEMSANSGTSPGAIALFGTPGRWSARSYGSGAGLSNASTAATYTAPRLNALLASSDISADTLTLAADGTQAASSAADQGSGNYGDHVLNIAGRDLSGTPSLRFTGGMFGTLFIVDANVVPADLAAEMLRDIARVAGHTY